MFGERLFFDFNSCVFVLAGLHFKAETAGFDAFSASFAGVCSYT